MQITPVGFQAGLQPAAKTAVTPEAGGATAAPGIAPVELDPVDVSSFAVVRTDTDAGKVDHDPKKKMKLKEYIAYVLMLLEKLRNLREPGPGPLHARLENRDELARVVDDLQPPGLTTDQ